MKSLMMIMMMIMLAPVRMTTMMIHDKYDNNGNNQPYGSSEQA